MMNGSVAVTVVVVELVVVDSWVVWMPKMLGSQ